MTFDVCVNLIEEEALIKGDETFVEAEQKLIAEETKLACVHYLLLCLKRELRLPFIMGEVFGIKNREGAEILELTPTVYRQRLSRGRKQIMDFLIRQCSLVDSNNPCHCEALAVLHVKKGHIDPKNPFFVCHLRRDNQTKNLLKELDQLAKAAMLIRNHPQYAAPGVLVESMKGMIDSGRFQLLDRI